MKNARNGDGNGSLTLLTPSSAPFSKASFLTILLKRSVVISLFGGFSVDDRQKRAKKYAFPHETHSKRIFIRKCISVAGE